MPTVLHGHASDVILSLQALAPTLHEALSLAIADAHAGASGLLHERHPHVRPLLTRSHFRENLEAQHDLSGWGLGGDPRLMGQIYLVNTGLGLRLRFLKERRKSYPGGVPVAGRNPARRAVWAGEEQLEIFHDDGCELASGMPHLLLLWDYLWGQNPHGLPGFTLRAVQPLAPGQYGQAVPLGFSLDISRNDTMFTSLVFPGAADDDNLFAEIDTEANEA